MSEKQHFSDSSVPSYVPPPGPPPSDSKTPVYAPPSGPPPTYDATQESRPQDHQSAADQSAYLDDLRAWADKKDQMRPGDGTILGSLPANGSVMPLAFGGYGMMQPAQEQGPDYQSYTAGFDPTKHAKPQQSAAYHGLDRPQMHGRTKSEEGAYLESLREWAKEKQYVRPGDGTMQGMYQGPGQPLEEEEHDGEEKKKHHGFGSKMRDLFKKSGVH